MATRRGFNPDLSQNQGTTTVKPVKTTEKTHALATHHFPSIHAKKRNDGGQTAVKKRGFDFIFFNQLNNTGQERHKL
jgi:hypothetical protein